MEKQNGQGDLAVSITGNKLPKKDMGGKDPDYGECHFIAIVGAVFSREFVSPPKIFRCGLAFRSCSQNFRFTFR